MDSINAMFRSSVAIWLVAWARTALAEVNTDDLPYNYYSSNALVPRPWFAQFESWYPHNAKYLIDISTGPCNLTLQDYRTAFAAPRDSINAKKLLSMCYRHEACIFDQIPTNHLLNYQSALVVLGLVPTLMSYIGPSIAEISLLYAHRPILSALLSLGTPTISPRLFKSNKPNHTRLTTLDGLIPRQGRRWVAAAVSTGEYLLAAGAAANAIFTALGMARKTILAWGCTTQFMPLLWALLPSVLYAIAGANYYFLMPKRTTYVTRKSSSKNSSSTENLLRYTLDTIHRWLVSETTVCANREEIREENRPRSKECVPVVRLLDIGIGIGGFVHFIFGTAAIASLQFVTVMDTFRKIVLPFAISTFICRLILIVELDGLTRSVTENSVEFDQLPSVHPHVDNPQSDIPLLEESNNVT